MLSESMYLKLMWTTIKAQMQQQARQSAPITANFGSKTTAIEVLQDVDLTGKTFLVTGTTSGIGFETARALALKNAHVVMANRNVGLAEKVRKTIYTETDKRNIDIVRLDLSSFHSVEEAAEEIKANDWPLHTLILNAAALGPGQKVSGDGYEATFATNHLGHFYLTNLLLDKLRESQSGRIVVVSSRSHASTRIPINALLSEKLTHLMPPYNTKKDPFTLYACSKLCNVLFALKLHREEHANGINTYIVHPGAMIGTNMWKNWAASSQLGDLILKPFVKSVEQAAATTVYCAATDHVKEKSGHYYQDCMEADNNLCKELACDNALQDALWNESMEIIGQNGLDI